MTALQMDLRERVISAIDESAEDLIALSRFIHAHPEIALQEVQSSAACADFLERRGFAVTRGVADLPTAFRADAGPGGGPAIAYLSEYDALPGVGHGCGHNLIAIAGIGAGVGLKAALGDLAGKVSVFGTPAEEAVGGKVIMADAGIFADIDVAMGAHPGTSEASCPTVEGSGNALACCLVRIEFHGKPAHAAADPFNGINALNAVIEVFNGINALRQQMRADGRIHGIVTHGGDVANVIPHYAAAEFFVRGATLAYMSELQEMVKKIAEGGGEIGPAVAIEQLITGTRLEYSMPERPNSDMITNYALAKRLKANLDEVGLAMPEAKAEEGRGSTDWGNVSYVVPSVETSYPILDHVCTWHSQEVVEASVSELGFANTIKVAKGLALTGLDLIANPAGLAEIRREYTTSLAARTGANGH